MDKCKHGIDTYQSHTQCKDCVIDKLQADNKRFRKALDIAKTHLEYQYPLRAIEVIDKALQEQGEKK